MEKGCNLAFMLPLLWLAVSGILSGPPALAEGEPGPARLAADLAPGTIDNEPRGYSGFLRLGNRSVFFRRDEIGHQSLWVTDGTPEGTEALGEAGSYLDRAAPVGSTGSVAFYITGYKSYDVWRTDGTRMGTFRLKSGRHSHRRGRPVISLGGGLLFFVITSEVPTDTLWASDGSLTGTFPIGRFAREDEVLDLKATPHGAFVMVREASGNVILCFATRAGVVLLRRFSEANGMLFVTGNQAFFVARADGNEVWTSDGTAARTRPVTDFVPDDPEIQIEEVVGGRAYFNAHDGNHGHELWSAGSERGSLRHLWDGPGGFVRSVAGRVVFRGYRSGVSSLWTSRGDLDSTAPITTGCPEGCPLFVETLVSLTPERLIAYGQDEEGKQKFWVTDGTVAGTRLLGVSGRILYLARGLAFDGHALFEIADEHQAGDLWITDGTVAGTFFVTRGGTSWSHYYGWVGPHEVGMANGRLVFPGRMGDTRAEGLWINNGTPSGSSLLIEAQAARSSRPLEMKPFRDGLLVQTCGEPYGAPAELWFLPSGGEGNAVSLHSEACHQLVDSAQIVTLGDVAVFLWFGSPSSLWRTDGTPEGTVPLFTEAAERRPMALVPWGDRAAVWVLVPGSPFRSELWVVDGRGLLKLLELPAGTEMRELTAAAGRLWFFDEVVHRGNRMIRPWVSDGTRVGTHPLVRSAGPAPEEWLDDPVPFVEAGRHVYFLFGKPSKQFAIWKTDGTVSGTVPAVTPASGAAGPVSLTAIGKRLFFGASRGDDPAGRIVPWVSDGTDKGTVLLTRARIEVSPYEASFVKLGDRIFFAASDPQHGEELWSTDGTFEGTARLLEIAPDLLDAQPRELTVWNGRLYFQARDALHGAELWSTDGSAKGTRLIQDIFPGATGSGPKRLTVTEEGLYFSAHDRAYGGELWLLPVGLDLR